MSYDWNIDHYTKKELLAFFGLTDTDVDPRNTGASIAAKKEQMVSVIRNDESKDEATKIYIIHFIQEASRKLEESYATLINNSTILSRVPNPDLDTYDISRIPANGGTTSSTDHPIVNKPYTNFTYTNNSIAFDGVVNPIERRIVTKVLSIDTLYRENFCSTNSNSFTVELASPLTNVINMKLISLELPRMWYSVSGMLGNNTMQISLYNMVDYPNNTQRITLPDGNYTNTELVSLLNNYFTNIGMGLDYLRFDVSATNSKATFYVKSDPAVDTILPYDPANAHYSPNFYYTLEFRDDDDGDPETCDAETLGFYLGYQAPVYQGSKSDTYVDVFFSSPAVTYYGVIEGETSCGVAFDRYLFVDINDFNKNFNTNTIMSQYNKSFLGNNILGRVALPGLPDGGVLIHCPSDDNFKTREYFGPVKIRKLHISLLNKQGKPLDLLNNNYSLSLEFNLLYS